MQNNLFFELIPLAIFFVVYYLSKNIFLATSVCIVVCWMQLIMCLVIYRKVSRNLWISTLLITIFGGLTVFFHNKTFIFVKPTVLYWLIALFMLVSDLIGKNLLEKALAKEFTLNKQQWRTLAFAWSIFFVLLGIVNLFVAFYCSEYTWVRFKVFGALSMLLVFTIASGIFVYYHDKKQKQLK